MPSAAKIEKQASLDTNDNPLKQVQVLVDKKIRNLEKRKVRHSMSRYQSVFSFFVSPLHFFISLLHNLSGFCKPFYHINRFWILKEIF